MSTYKHTLHLPDTEFPMKASLAEREPVIQERWKAMSLYQQLREKSQGKPPFILLDGPPYANGDIHLGHALNKILKDIIIKSKLASGYDAPFVPNWDCHGLPIEHQVEKQKGKVGDQIDAAAFRAACRAYANTQIENQIRDFKRLGVFADFDHPTRTMDFTYQADVIRTLANIVRHGHVVQGKKPVHWCVSCGSSLAEAEVEYQDKQSPSIDICFPVQDMTTLASRFHMQHKVALEQAYCVIWTTTPWTLPANVAIAVGADFDYVLVRFANEPVAYVVAEACLPEVESRKGQKVFDILGRCKGAALEHMVCEHPFEPRVSPVVLGFHVTTSAGTGFVHMAPAHGTEDYLICQQYKIAGLNLVGPNGAFFADVPHVAGLFVFKANPIVLDLLKAKQHLFAEHTVSHSYPHCWRHKTPLIFRATPQWFISMEKEGLRQAALEAIREVKWIPERGEARIRSMIEERPDWCISRQRYWGVPLAFLMHRETGALHPRMVDIMATVADRVAEKGVEVWFESKVEDWLPASEAPDYILSKNTLDVWFDSGASSYCVLESVPGLSFPADLYLEGSDQHRGWFQTSLLTSLAQCGKAPFKQVLTHGYTVDAKGHKMSKSLGNVIAPQKIINELGADVLRLWVASVDYGNEITVADEIFKRSADVYRRLRNTTRFLLGNCHDFDPSLCVPLDQLLPLDQWAIAKAHALQETVLRHYESYQFHLVVQALHHFCSLDLGSFYLDIIKDRQYTLQKDSHARRSAQTAMYHIVKALAILFGPILSHTAEEIWQYLPGQHSESVFFEPWSQELKALSPHALLSMADWDRVIQIREAVSKVLEEARASKIIGAGLEAGLSLYLSASDYALLARFNDELRFVFITSSARIFHMNEAPHDATTLEEGNLKVKLLSDQGQKCGRCWHRRPDVGQHVAHPELCDRCIQNVDGAGETRSVA